MTTVYGAWEGSPYQARIKLVYTRTLTVDKTQVQFDGEWFIEFEGSVVDSSNSWALGGDQPDKSGTNRDYNVPSGGGTVNFADMNAFNRTTDATVTGSVTGVQAVGGGTINASFVLAVGALAPYWTDETCAVISITSTTATVTGYAAAGNGGTLNNVKLQRNTSPSETGATTLTRGSWQTTFPLTGLAPNTTYYYRIAPSNSNYGYGDYSAWQSFKTASGLPGVPGTGWSLTPSQTGFTVSGNTVADNGGSAITGWNVYYNTSATTTGATVLSGSSATVAPAATDVGPGTYYVAIAAKNANGVGTLSAWKTVTILPAAYVNVAGVWKPAAAYVNVAGVWKPATRYDAVLSNGQVIWKT